MKVTSLIMFALIASTSASRAAPQSFYGKTFRATWNETRVQRVHGEGEFREQSIPISFTVYVSSKGQLFKRFTSTNASGRRTGVKDRVGESGSGAEGAGNVSFQGNTLIAAGNNNGLGRRIRITFDGSSSCSAEVLTGKAGSGITSFRSNVSGKMMDLQSVSAGSASCSVQDGNAFAS
jgi:hypothetical protein